MPLPSPRPRRVPWPDCLPPDLRAEYDRLPAAARSRYDAVGHLSHAAAIDALAGLVEVRAESLAPEAAGKGVAA